MEPRLGRTYNLRVPATTANLGPGYDCLGAALGLFNEFKFTLTPPGEYTVEIDGPEAGDLQLNAGRNLSVDAFNIGWQHGWDELDAPTSDAEYTRENPPGLAQRINVKIPSTRGLGSSSSAIVAGMVAGFHAAKGELNEPVLLREMARLEGHPDNVLPAFLGGVVCAMWDGETLRYHQRPIAPNLHAILYIPDTKLSTHRAREVLPTDVPLADAIFNASRTPLVLEGLIRGLLPMLADVMEDRLHQPYRRTLIADYDLVEDFAKRAGLPCVISGAGPSILLWEEATKAKSTALELQMTLKNEKRRGDVRLLRPINHGLMCPELRPTK